MKYMPTIDKMLITMDNRKIAEIGLSMQTTLFSNVIKAVQ